MTATAVIQTSVLSPACLASIQKNALATAHESAPKNQGCGSATERPPPPGPLRPFLATSGTGAPARNYRHRLCGVSGSLIQ
jgi:hypothetical protein